MDNRGYAELGDGEMLQDAVFRAVKPTQPGAFYVRGWATIPNLTALVEVVYCDVRDEMACNLHLKNSDRSVDEWPLLCELRNDFNWHGPLPQVPASKIPQPKVYDGTEKIYAERDVMAQCQFYVNHVNAMTAEGLHSKSDIAAELAHRDIQIAELQSELKAIKDAANIVTTLADALTQIGVLKHRSERFEDDARRFELLCKWALSNEAGNDGMTETISSCASIDEIRAVIDDVEHVE